MFIAKIYKPKNHWLVCSHCGGKGGIKWQDIPHPLCEACLVDLMTQLNKDRNDQ